ncbi:MAG: hypothetical protein JSR67_03880 [Proteobacteria bacterium]|nr:hypothetical protein [Pseudomonadota bacterium]
MSGPEHHADYRGEPMIDAWICWCSCGWRSNVYFADFEPRGAAIAECKRRIAEHKTGTAGEMVARKSL